jgi:hypothetical protein
MKELLGFDTLRSSISSKLQTSKFDLPSLQAAIREFSKIFE